MAILLYQGPNGTVKNINDTSIPREQVKFMEEALVLTRKAESERMEFINKLLKYDFIRLNEEEPEQIKRRKEITDRCNRWESKIAELKGHHESI